ncbi:MAG TPA: hypothetical protein V6D17_18990 [Candidatus Obscuribacterales bacterium]
MLKGIKMATSLTSIFLSLIALNACQTPAFGLVSDPGIVSQLMEKRRGLLTREATLLRDQDDLLRRIDDLRRNKEKDNQAQLNELCRKSDAKYWELRQVRFDLQDVETRLM